MNLRKTKNKGGEKIIKGLNLAPIIQYNKSSTDKPSSFAHP
jgi:hypothetical protein